MVFTPVILSALILTAASAGAYAAKCLRYSISGIGAPERCRAGARSNAGADILAFLCCSSAAAYHANADSAAGYRFEFLAIELGFVRHFGGKIFGSQLVPALFGKLQYFFIGFQ